MLSFDKIPFNWFDLLVLIMIVFGLVQGRKRGLSLEVFTMLFWLMVVIVCAFTYMPLGDVLSGVAPFGLLNCYLVSYLAVAGTLALVYFPIKRALAAKMIDADSFGSAEYYVGMPAGAVRFACILLALLALLNARYYTNEELAISAKYQKENYGSEFFPGLNTLQADVFDRSLTGHAVKEHLDVLLIKPTPASKHLTVRARQRR
jgi:uncharacterized membrane protein required for colicin V production